MRPAMTMQRLVAIRDRLERWGKVKFRAKDRAVYEQISKCQICATPNNSSAQFIAKMLNDVPALLAEVSRLQGLHVMAKNDVDKKCETCLYSYFYYVDEIECNFECRRYRHPDGVGKKDCWRWRGELI